MRARADRLIEDAIDALEGDRDLEPEQDGEALTEPPALICACCCGGRGCFGVETLA